MSFDQGILYKMDLTVNPPVANPILTALNGPGEILLVGNDLYITQFGGEKVSKIDITDPNPTAVDVVVGLGGPFNLLLNGDFIYVTEFSGGAIKRFNYNDANPVATLVTAGVVTPNGLAINGTDLFISERTPGKISKFDLTILNVPVFNASEEIVLFPNPSENGFQLSGLKEETAYTIVSVAGQVVASGIVFSEEKINAEKLSNGLYFIKLENGLVLRFQKK